MIYPNDFLNKVVCADCLEVMKEMPDNSIDTIITDPPYGLEFMGKAWDRFPSDIGPKKPFANRSKEQKLGGSKYQEWTKQWTTEALRVAKPGATLLCFGGTRTFHRLACAIEDAGWVIKDCLMYLYGSGFPKATDISLQLDKKAGVQGQRGVGGFNTGGIQEQQNRKAKLYIGSTTDGSKMAAYNEPKTEEAKLWNGWKSHGLKPAYEPIIMAMKPNEGSYSQNALRWKVSGLNIDGSRIKSYAENDISNNKCYDTQKTQQNIKTYDSDDLSDLPKGVSDMELSLEKGIKKTTNLRKGMQSEINNRGEELQLEGRQDDKTRRIYPNKQNGEIRTSGSGGGNRREQSDTPQEWQQSRQQIGKFRSDKSGKPYNEISQRKEQTNGEIGEGKIGRFPSNIILSCECDEVREGKAQGSQGHWSQTKVTGYGKTKEYFGVGKKDDMKVIIHTNPECPCYMLDEQSGGVGGDKRKSKSTYDKGIWGNARAVESNALYNDAGGASRFFYCAKSSRSERNMGLEGLNNHPTVKPLKLMEYLCILTKTPKGGVILDPFTGSGTTLIAAKKIGRDFIGIEKEKEYCEIAEARIKAIPKPLF